MDVTASSSSPTSSSSTSSSTARWKYDVFLSFRGEDTRYSFTDLIYAALIKEDINTFKDDEKLEKGKLISELFKVIEQSRFAIVIFSKDYASSTWCLDELAKIVQCEKEKGMTFYLFFMMCSLPIPQAQIIQSIVERMISEKATEKQWPLTYEEISSDLNKLELTMSTIQAVLQDAEEKQVKNQGLTVWLGQVKDVFYEVADVRDEFECEALRRQVVKRHGSTDSASCSSFNPRDFSHKIKVIRERFEEIAKVRAQFHLVERLDDKLIVQREMTHSFVSDSDVIGRDDDKKKIIDLLMHPNEDGTVPVISIVGIGGLGKTTLAQWLYNDERVAKKFDSRIWVCVFEDFTILKVAKKILKSAKVEISENMSIDEVQATLRSYLKEKRFFIVLDDVWNEDRNKWIGLKKLLIEGANGSKIVVTTRSHKVATVMAPGPIHDLIGLPEDDCLFLFLKWAFIEGEEKQYPKLVEIGKHIVKKCSGVPLAVRTLGSLLYSKTEERDWIDIRDDEIWKLEQNVDDILPADPTPHSPSQVGFSSCESLISLPQGLKHLTALESLLICKCGKINLMEGEDYPTRLRSLRIILSPKLVALPHWLIQSATTLQFLLIGWCQNLAALPEWLPNLTSLQNLQILICRKLSSLPEGMGRLTALRELEINCGELSKNYAAWRLLSEYEDILVLKIPTACQFSNNTQHQKVSNWYGEQAAQVTNEGFDAAGHAIGTAWAMFKIGKAFDPKSTRKPTSLAKVAAEENSAELKAKWTGVLFGGALLALSNFSLKIWKEGKSSLRFILGQADKPTTKEIAVLLFICADLGREPTTKEIEIPKLVHQEISHSSETLCSAVGRGVCRESFLRLFNIYSPENVYRSIFLQEDNSDGLSFESRTFGFSRLIDLSPSEIAFLATGSSMERLLFSVMRWDRQFLDGIMDSLMEAMDDDPECSYLERGKVRAVARMLLMPSRSDTNLLESKYATGPGDSPFEALVVPHQDRFLSNSRPLHSAYTFIPRSRAPPIGAHCSDRNFAYKMSEELHDPWVKRLFVGFARTSEHNGPRKPDCPPHHLIQEIDSELPVSQPALELTYKIFGSSPPMRSFDPAKLLTDSGKLQTLDILLKRLRAANHRVLLFAQMTKMLNILEDYMNYRKYRYLRLDGSSTITDRRDMVRDFQHRSDIFVFLLSTRAGGLGINLTAADTVIFYESDWNPTLDLQAMDRAHRLGQTKDVTVYRLICKETVEEKILQRASQKSTVQQLVMTGGHVQGDLLAPEDVVSLLLDDAQLEQKLREIPLQVKDRQKKKLSTKGIRVDAEGDASLEDLTNAEAQGTAPEPSPDPEKAKSSSKKNSIETKLPEIFVYCGGLRIPAFERRLLTNKLHQSKGIPQNVTSPMDYEFDDSLQNSEPQAQKPKRPKRPTKSVNENLQPAFTGTPMAGPEQTHYLPVNELGSGGFRVGQDTSQHSNPFS
uniref:Chromatin-remodeling ATPase INO80 n=2 Tax=Fagus sylvatica TaxID=28930 RepID=A0A2N9HD90_FAGSY